MIVFLFMFLFIAAQALQEVDWVLEPQKFIADTNKALDKRADKLPSRPASEIEKAHITEVKAKIATLAAIIKQIKAIDSEIEK